jgi:hypothetical protein
MIAQGNVNKMFYGMTWSFIGLQLYIKIIIVIFHQHNSCMCISYGLDYSRWRKYELIPESESEQRKADINLTEFVEDPNQSSEEPKAKFAQEGKPRSMNPILNLWNVITSTYMCIKLIGVTLKP